MREKGSWSDTTYKTKAVVAKTRGTATYEGEDRARQGKTLDPLVDPSKYDVIRLANNLLVPEGDEFVLKFGVAMPVETDLDTTGSMGGNVDIAFRVLPKVQNLLVQGPKAVLKRYHTQIATGIIQDRVDRYPYLRSQFEPDNEVERQMGLLVPERGGEDNTEDYQLGLFAAALLTSASITSYGLKGYHFIVGDEIGRDEFDVRVLEQVFGPDVLKKAFGSKTPQTLPSTAEVAKKALENWHIFYLQVGNRPRIAYWWTKLIGQKRVILLPRTEDIAEVQACVIGLTEGVLDTQSAVEFLKESGVADNEASRIVNAVAGIPIGLQATYPNFGRIPSAGSRFKTREDIWPADSKKSGPKRTPPKKKDENGGADGKESKPDWKI